jgi:uncharacterized protein (TIGR00730 family)
MNLQSVCVFCGSSMGARPSYRADTEDLGRHLAARGIELVYGGGKVGLMGVLADACLDAGGRVTGVIPQMLVDKEVAHSGLSHLHVVRSMHERKAMMADLAGAFIALPGGFGTFEEFCEIVTWTQLGLQRKPCGLLNVDGYYDPLLAMFDRAVNEGFVKPAHRSLIVAGKGAAAMLDALESQEPPQTDKWIVEPGEERR